MTNDRGKNHYSPRMTTLFGLVACAIMALYALNLYYFKAVEESLLNQTYQDLKQENDKALVYFQSMMESDFEWLEVLAAYCDLPDGSGTEQWWNEIETYRKDGIRLGIADNQGIIYFGDHQSENISAREYYQKALKGEKSISKVLTEDFEGQDGVVLSVPIMRNGKSMGAACIEYTTEKLGKYINSTDFSKFGSNIIFSRTGDLLVTYKECEEYDTIYKLLETMEFHNRDSLENMKKAVKSGSSGYVTFYKNDSKRLLYYQPVGVEDWVVGSLVETGQFESTLHRIRGLSKSFITSSTIMLVCAILLNLFIFYVRLKESKRAQKDYLTGVYTRETAQKLVEAGLKSSGGKKRFYACLFIDIDDFKKINDTYGHHKGDMVLAQVGQILSVCTRDEDVIVRFGGDEFCIWLYGVKGCGQPEVIADRILTAFHVAGKVETSIGITLIKDNEVDYDTILKRADEALYEAKRKGKNQFAIRL